MAESEEKAQLKKVKVPSMDSFLQAQRGVTPILESLFKSRARHAKPDQYDAIFKELWR